MRREAAAGHAGVWACSAATGDAFETPLGPRPLAFLALMFAIGLLASWRGALCWNEDSQRVPPS